MSENLQARLAKLVGKEFPIWPDAASKIAAALVAAGVTLPEPEPEPEWRVVREYGGLGVAAIAEQRVGAVWQWRSSFFSEADAREYVARKLAKPLDVEALADTCRAALGIKDSVRTLLPEGRTNWCNGIRRVLELAQVGTVAMTPAELAVIEAAKKWHRYYVGFTDSDGMDQRVELGRAVDALLNERAK